MLDLWPACCAFASPVVGDGRRVFLLWCRSPPRSLADQTRGSIRPHESSDKILRVGILLRNWNCLTFFGAAQCPLEVPPLPGLHGGLNAWSQL